MKPARSTIHRGRGAFTLVELAVSMVLVGIIFLAVTMTGSTASSTYEHGQMRSDLDARAHRVLQFLARELDQAGRADLDPDPGTVLGADEIGYRHPVGWAGGVQWGPERRIWLELESGEVDDGADNNGNGLVDERVIVWVEDEGGPNERRTIKSRWVREMAAGELPGGGDDNGNGLVDEPGLAFLGEGDVVTIFLTLERRDPKNRLQTKTVQTSVRVRN